MNFKTLLPVTLFSVLGTAQMAQSQIDRPSFFRDGQRLMEQEVRRLEQQQLLKVPPQQVEHPSQLLTITSGPLSWQKFIFRDAGFSIWMPQGLQSNETVAIATLAGELSFEVFSTHPTGSKFARFVTAYSNPVAPIAIKDPPALLESVRDGIVTERNFQLQADQPMTWEGFPGRQLTMKDADETIIFRMYVIGQRVYVLAVNQKDLEAIAEEVTTYFQSFRLLK